MAVRVLCGVLFDDGAHGSCRCSRVPGHPGRHSSTAASRLAGLAWPRFERAVIEGRADGEPCRVCRRVFPYDPGRELCRECAADAAGWTPDYALSLARTAITDPAGLPADVDTSGWRPGHAGFDADAYAVERIDEALGALVFEAGGSNDEAGELAWVLTNIGRLLVGVTEGLGETNDPGGCVIEHLTAALDAIDDAVGAVRDNGNPWTES